MISKYLSTFQFIFLEIILSLFAIFMIITKHFTYLYYNEYLKDILTDNKSIKRNRYQKYYNIGKKYALISGVLFYLSIVIGFSIISIIAFSKG